MKPHNLKQSLFQSWNSCRDAVYKASTKPSEKTGALLRNWKRCALLVCLASAIAVAGVLGAGAENQAYADVTYKYTGNAFDPAEISHFGHSGIDNRAPEGQFAANSPSTRPSRCSTVAVPAFISPEIGTKLALTASTTPAIEKYHEKVISYHLTSGESGPLQSILIDDVLLLSRLIRHLNAELDYDDSKNTGDKFAIQKPQSNSKFVPQLGCFSQSFYCRAVRLSWEGRGRL